MLRTKMYKNNSKDMDKYSNVAAWCNANNARIVDQGEYYEVVEVPLPTLDELKQAKLAEIDEQTKATITGGFKSSAGGELAVFDSTEADQSNLQIMLNASKSPSFETDETYKGHIPIRGIPDGETSKKTYLLNAIAMQLLTDDLAKHIGLCKRNAWIAQEQVAKAKTIEDLEKINWSEGA